MPRIDPVHPPYAPEIAERLEAMMPLGVPPILLFRTLARNLPMATAMGGWGGYELSKRLSLPMRGREIVIDRTCARCGCEYEWGVHVAFFAARAGLTGAQVTSLTHGAASIHAGPTNKIGCSSRRLTPSTTPRRSAMTYGTRWPGCSPRGNCWTC